MFKIKTTTTVILFIGIFLLSFQTRAEELSGTVDHHVYFPVHVLHDGQVLNVHANVGDVVDSGALLIEMDATSQIALIASRKSKVTRLSIETKSMEAQFERDTEMFDRGSMSLLAYENAENALKIVREDLSAARSQLRIAEHELNQTRITAPFDAIVLRQKVHPGMNIKADSRKRPLMKLASARDFVVKADFEYTMWAELKKSGFPSHVTVNGTIYSVNEDSSSFYYRKSKEGTKYIMKIGFTDDTATVVPGLAATFSY